MLCYGQVIIASSEKQSMCTQIQNSLHNVFVATDINLARWIMSDNDLLCKAAESKNSKYIQYCLQHNIGTPSYKNEEGHTPLSIAQACCHDEIVKIIVSSPTSVAYKKWK